MSQHVATEEKAEKPAEGFQRHLDRIVYLLTKQPDAAVYVPQEISPVDYVKYCIAVEHANNTYPSAFVITDELIEYGIAESELVFHR